jgi:hypothetical protein
MDDRASRRVPLQLSRDYGDEVLRVSGRQGSWAAINRVSVDGAHWLVAGDDHDDGGSWTAAPLDEPVMTTVLDDELVIAGRAENSVAKIVVGLNGQAHTATTRADGLWLMLAGSMGDATELVVLSIDQRGNHIANTLVEFIARADPDRHLARSRFLRWLRRGFRGHPRGTGSYGRL